jgi:tRNA pseudouridine55 synthase
MLRYEYPDADLDITCSTGTYIRSLGNDIAASLGTAAVMTSLTRESVGPFERAQAIPAERMSRETILAHLRPAADAVPGLPRYVAADAERDRIAHGRLLEINPPSDVTELAAVDQTGALLAILQRGDRGWRPSPNLIGVQ